MRLHTLSPLMQAKACWSVLILTNTLISTYIAYVNFGQGGVCDHRESPRPVPVPARAAGRARACTSLRRRLTALSFDEWSVFALDGAQSDRPAEHWVGRRAPCHGSNNSDCCAEAACAAAVA